MAIASPDSPSEHELRSELMLVHLVKSNNLAAEIDDSEIGFINDLIHGAPRSHSTRQEKPFLFDIVNNKRNSVDVDKFDYIQRDCHNIGLKCSIDAKRLITFSRVVDDQICFNQKEAYNLYEVLST